MRKSLLATRHARGESGGRRLTDRNVAATPTLTMDEYLALALQICIANGDQTNLKYMHVMNIYPKRFQSPRFSQARPSPIQPIGIRNSSHPVHFHNTLPVPMPPHDLGTQQHLLLHRKSERNRPAHCVVVAYACGYLAKSSGVTSLRALRD